MKFLEKHKKFISRVLVVTVSLMLLLSSLPVGASVNTSALNRTKHNFQYVEIYGNKSYQYSSDLKCSFDRNYGNYNDFHLFFILSEFIPVNSGNVNNKSIAFSVCVPTHLLSNLNNFKIGLSTNLSSFSLKIDGSSIIKSYDNVGGAYGDITLLNFYIDPERLASMHKYAGNFQIDGIDIATFNGAAATLGLHNYFRVFDFYDCYEELKPTYGDAVKTFLYHRLGNFFQSLSDNISSAINFLSFGLSSQISDISGRLERIWNFLEPFLTPILEYVFLPVLHDILDAIIDLTVDITDAFAPLIADIINYFVPYFNKIINIITENFLNLTKGLTPILNQFITDISPSFDSIVENTSKNIRLIVEECFIPSDSSKEFQEFISFRDDLTNKFPIFSQLKAFVSVLFDPMEYNAGNSFLYSNFVCSFPNKTFPIGSTTYYYRCNFNFKVNNSYYITFNFSGKSGRIQYIRTSGGYISGVSIKKGSNSILFSSDINVSSFEFVVSGSSDSSTVISDICLYSVDSSAGENFTVNVYGKKVSVLDFDWYMPYKHYGDICVIAFCYLAFIWHTFKKLPSII